MNSISQVNIIGCNHNKDYNFKLTKEFLKVIQPDCICVESSLDLLESRKLVESEIKELYPASKVHLDHSVETQELTHEETIAKKCMMHSFQHLLEYLEQDHINPDPSGEEVTAAIEYAQEHGIDWYPIDISYESQVELSVLNIDKDTTDELVSNSPALTEWDSEKVLKRYRNYNEPLTIPLTETREEKIVENLLKLSENYKTIFLPIGDSHVDIIEHKLKEAGISVEIWWREPDQ